jgi:ABC-type Fe3+ transport system permease subunit
LYLRSQNRHRWLLISLGLDGYAEIKRELNHAGFPFARPVLPPNWEEFVLVLLFIGTMICAVSLHSLKLQLLNLAISILVGSCGAFVINSNPDNFPRMQWSRFFMFLPVLVAVWQI